MLSRKAQIKFWQKLIIGVAFLLIIIGVFLVSFVRKSEYEVWKAQCKTSVESNVAWRRISNVFAENIRCPTRDIHIDDDLDETKGRNAAIKEIKKLVVDCWDIYGKGEKDLFSGETTYCGVCAIFDFKEKNREIRLFGKEFDYSGTFNSNNIYSVIFIYPRGEQEIQQFERMLERETGSGKIVAYIGPHIGTGWGAASVFAEYTAEGLDRIGCESMPVEQ